MAEEGTSCKVAKAAYDLAPAEPVDAKAALKKTMDEACSGADQEKIWNSWNSEIQ